MRGVEDRLETAAVRNLDEREKVVAQNLWLDVVFPAQSFVSGLDRIRRCEH